MQCLHPFAGYLLLRGLATLPVRVRRAAATAAELAGRLAEHPAVRQVFYPGHRAAGRVSQMDGGGCLVSFESTGDLRLSIGLEDVDDLWHDLDQCLTKSAERSAEEAER